MEAIYFDSPATWRAWLAENHDTATEVLVGFYKKGTGRPSLTWPESVDQALCYGWIDGVRRGVDDERYTIRFTPRKKTSNWSAVNIARVAELTELGLMQPAGLKAFAARKQEKSAQYAYENRPQDLEEDHERRFRENPAAWEFFRAQSAGYRRTSIWWIVSAKQEATRLRRLDALIAASEKGQRLTEVEPQRKRPGEDTGD